MRNSKSVSFAQFITKMQHAQYFVSVRQIVSRTIAIEGKLKRLSRHCFLCRRLTRDVARGMSWSRFNCNGDRRFECDALAKRVDTYYTNHVVESRPTVARPDFWINSANSNAADNQSSRTNNCSIRGEANNRMGISVSLSRDNRGAASGGSSQTYHNSGLCLTCHSPGHE